MGKPNTAWAPAAWTLKLRDGNPCLTVKIFAGQGHLNDHWVTAGGEFAGSRERPSHRPPRASGSRHRGEEQSEERARRLWRSSSRWPPPILASSWRAGQRPSLAESRGVRLGRFSQIEGRGGVGQEGHRSVLGPSNDHVHRTRLSRGDSQARWQSLDGTQTVSLDSRWTSAARGETAGSGRWSDERLPPLPRLSLAAWGSISWPSR